jgi:hypothetical protein
MGTVTGTGDNARCVFCDCKMLVIVTTLDNRHDTDSVIPRTPVEIRDMNREVARKMDRIFTPRGVAVVPSIGVSSCGVRRSTTDQPFLEQ